MLIMIAECYANNCVGKALKRILVKRASQHIRIFHNRKMGRDRILKDLLRIAEQKNDIIIAIIDYEKGIARIYVEKQFKMSQISESILLGISKQKSNLIAVIFDPNIEEAFLCNIDKAICKNPFYYEKVKSENACNILTKYLEKQYAQEVIRKLANALISTLSRI